MLRSGNGGGSGNGRNRIDGIVGSAKTTKMLISDRIDRPDTRDDETPSRKPVRP